MSFIERTKSKMHRYGFWPVLGKSLLRIVQVANPLRSAMNGNARRLTLSRKFMRDFDGVIQYGPLKGAKMIANSSWSRRDKAAMLFGLYEQEVLNVLSKAANSYKRFIDLGAADGYYGIGVVASGLFEHSTCYEMSKKGQEVLAKAALANDVEDKVDIRGIAREDFYTEFGEDERRDTLLFIDVEGAEFGILTQKTLEAFRHSAIIIEMHEWMVENGEAALAALRERAEKTHKINAFRTGSRDLSVFPELAMLCDTDRWLICSENRGRLMTWWFLEPLEK